MPMKRKRPIAWLTLLLTVSFPISVAAVSPYDGYIYNAWTEPVPCPIGYEAVKEVSGYDITQKFFKNPSDLFIAENGDIYISDTDNNRIVVCDGSFTFKRAITEILAEDGTARPLTAPGGLYVDHAGNVYVTLPADEAGKTPARVVKMDPGNKLLVEFDAPETDLLTENVEFKPSRVVANDLGTVFVVVDGLILGTVAYDKNGRFLSFYGANDVPVSIQLLTDMFWKKFMTQEQINHMYRYVPSQITSIDADRENFIYTCTVTPNSYSSLRKMNSLGDNILMKHPLNVPSRTGSYGDLQRAYYMGQSIINQFVDLCVNDDGMIFVLDKTYGRVFEYDQESKLLNIFGASGYQAGSFRNPIAVDSFGAQIYVLDKDKGTVTVFGTTEYGALIEKAVLLYNDGEYVEAKSIWEQVLKLNVNCELAYSGIGKALYEQGEYKAAIPYFKYGYDRTGYSRAYKEYRMQRMRQYSPYVFTGLLAAVIFLILFVKIRRHRRKGGVRG